MKYKNDKQIFTTIEHNFGGAEELPLLTFDLLNGLEGFRHCFTTRKGGVSQGVYESLNLSFTRGDDKEAVLENYRRVASYFGKEPDDIVTSDQTHTTTVHEVGRPASGFGVTRPRAYSDVDGLITNTPGVVLATFYADCVPLYFVDPVHRAIGLSHSGWRGTVGRMAKATLSEMNLHYGTKPEDVYAAIGPSICKDCYEISSDVAEAFSDAFPNHPEILEDKGFPYGHTSNEVLDHKYQLDLWRANEVVLLECGVKAEHIAVTNVCTCCNPDELFSHRIMGAKRGNLGAFLMIEE